MYANLNDIVRKNAGLILIEMMIAISIGFCLLSMLIQIYLTSQQQLSLITKLGHLQRNADRVMKTLTNDIHNAGYMGCARLTPEFPLYPVHNTFISADRKLMGKSVNDFTVRYMSPETTSLIEYINNQEIVVTSSVRYHAGDQLILSDCEHAELLTAKKIIYSPSVQRILAMSPFSQKFTSGAEVGQLKVHHYLVAKSSLFIQVNGQQKKRLAENVQQLQIHYLMPTEAGIRELSADAVYDWSKIMGAAIDIEMSIPPLHQWYHLYASSNSGQL